MSSPGWCSGQTFTNEENWYEIISVNFEQGYVVNDTVLISGIFTQNNMQGSTAKNGYTKNSHFGILNISCVAKGTINGIDPQNNSWELINIRLIGGDIPDSFLAYYLTDNKNIKICVKTNSAYINVFSFIQSGTLISSINSSAALVSETSDFVSIPHHLPFLGSDQSIIKISSVQSTYPGDSYIIDVMPEEGNVGPEIGDYIIDADGNVFIALESNNPVMAPETLSYCTGFKIPFYVKPSTGIGTSDLSSYVVRSLTKANSALQEAPVVPDGTYEAMTVGKALSATNAENADTADSATSAQDAAKLGGVAASNYAQTNGTYSGMTVGKATQADNAATATDSEKLGGVLADEYTLKTGTYPDMTVGNATNATNADTADSATSAQDAAKLGGVLAEDYATKEYVTNSISSAITTTLNTPV